MSHEALEYFILFRSRCHGPWAHCEKWYYEVSGSHVSQATQVATGRLGKQQEPDELSKDQ